MELIERPDAIQNCATRWHHDGHLVGLVPTMGYFHEGHLSLMRQARQECERVVVSLFVNPAQFGPGEDLQSYPRDLDRDCALAQEVGVDVLFAPSAEAMYPAGHCAFVDVAGLSDRLCGASRPGHFRGVATVVAKLFHLCRPQRAYFGAKDYQQSVIIERMICDLNIDVELVRCPTVREPDGLAMSSRNAYLSPEDRQAATVLSRALCEAKALVEGGATDAVWVRDQVRMFINAEPRARLEYAEVVEARTLESVEDFSRPTLIAVAARFGGARLIDNVAIRTA